MADKPAADENSIFLENGIPPERIFRIHESPCKAVLALTGGGAEIIGELLRHGSGSATVLEAIVPYDMEAMNRFLGRKPEKYCSEKTARLMAMVAYQRALELSIGSESSKSSESSEGSESSKSSESSEGSESPKNSEGSGSSKASGSSESSAAPDVIGIGATCKLKAAKERESRKHKVHVAIQAYRETGVRTLELTVDRTREEEEKIASALIFNVLACYCGIPEIDLPDGIGTIDGTGIWERKKEGVIEKYASVSCAAGDLLRQKKSSLESPNTVGKTRISFNGSINEAEAQEKTKPEEIKLVFSGSFDPCHKNHVFMSNCASKKYNSPVHFEISLTNVDKPPIDFISLNQRLDSLRKYKDEAFMGGVYLTNAPLFLQKADLFPNSTFIIGADTFNRLFDAKYYDEKLDTPAIIRHFKEKNVKFMVFRRKSVEMSINPEALEFCEIVPMEEYEDDGTSSREIRRKLECQ